MTPEREKEIKAEKIIAQFKERFKYPRVSTNLFWAELYHAIHIPIQELIVEVDRLRKIIAKELTDNDELGAEYTYVLVLKEENAQLREKLANMELAFEDAIATICGEFCGDGHHGVCIDQQQGLAKIRGKNA